MILITNAASKQTKAASLLWFNFLTHALLGDTLRSVKEVHELYEAVFGETVSYQTVKISHNFISRNENLFTTVHTCVMQNIEKQPDEIYSLLANKRAVRKYWFSQRDILLGAVRAVYYAVLAVYNYDTKYKQLIGE